MFRKAMALASGFTRPVVISRKSIGGSCGASIGAFVVVNQEGWIITAHHVLALAGGLIQEARVARDRDVALAAIQSDANLGIKEREKKIRHLGRLQPSATDRASVWWSWEGVQITDAVSLVPVDLAIARLQPFDPSWVPAYPKIKRPGSGFDPGISLCKLGFPFQSIEPTYDADRDAFALPPDALPIPFFPMDGIFTRVADIALRDPDGNRIDVPFPLRFLETSSPGLKGQSGGPTVDVEGAIWAIQSQTLSYSLGFTPPVPGGRAGETAHQFLNVGRGVHAETIAGALTERGVHFDLTTY